MSNQHYWLRAQGSVNTGSGLRALGSERPRPQPTTQSRSSTEPPAPSPKPSAFTLVELLVVIAILGILISLVTAGAQAARRRGAVTKAKTTVSALETAIAMYSSDMGGYPKTGNEELVKALQDDPHNVDWQGPYMEFKQDDLKDGQLIDPWGHPYAYVSINGGAQEHRPKSFDLFSLGPNGVDDHGTGDDIINR